MKHYMVFEVDPKAANRVVLMATDRRGILTGELAGTLVGTGLATHAFREMVSGMDADDLQLVAGMLANALPAARRLAGADTPTAVVSVGEIRRAGVKAAAEAWNGEYGA